MNDKLYIQDLTDSLAEKHGMDKQDAENFVREFFLLIEEALKKDKYVKIKGLGAFKLIDVDTRESVDVNTGERIKIEGHTKVSFTPDNALKDVVNRPFAHFETVVLNESTVFEDTAEESNGDEVEEVEASPAPVVEASAAKTPMATKSPAVAEVPAVSGKPVAEAKTADTTSMKYFVTIVVFIVLVCAGAVTFLYYPDWRSWSGSEAEQEQLSADTPVETPAAVPSAAPQDTLAESPAPSAEPSAEPVEQPAEQPLQQTQPKQQPQAKVQSAPKAAASKAMPKAVPARQVQDTSNYVITGTQTTYTLKKGETLTRVALRFFGTKAMWPYIVMHNGDVIKNPNNVPSGTRLKIPKLKPKKP